MKKHANKIVAVMILLLAIVVIAFSVIVHVKYGSKPIDEIPAWAVRFFIK